MVQKGEITSNTSNTPEVILNPNEMIEIEGRLIHQDLSAFFNQLEYLIDQYINSPAGTYSIDVHLHYKNDINSDVLITFLRKIKFIKQKDKKLIINLHFEDAKEDLFAQVEYITSVLDVPYYFVMDSEPTIDRRRSIRIFIT